MTVLTIDFNQKELEKIKVETADQQSKLQSLMSKTDLNKLKDELKAMTEKYTHELRRNKLNKFKRDTIDYKEGMVYPWLAHTVIPLSPLKLDDRSETPRHLIPVSLIFFQILIVIF